MVNCHVLPQGVEKRQTMKKFKRVCRSVFDETLLRFILVGAVNTAIGYTAMFLCYNVFHLNYWISSASNYVVGGTASYFMNRRFTFHSNRCGWKLMVIFAVNIAVCAFLGHGISKPLAQFFLPNASQSVVDHTAMLGGSAIYFCLNYLSQKYIVFRSKTT